MQPVKFVLEEAVAIEAHDKEASGHHGHCDLGWQFNSIKEGPNKAEKSPKKGPKLKFAKNYRVSHG